MAFIVGGTTYEEARAVAEANAAGERGQGVQICQSFFRTIEGFLGSLTVLCCSNRQQYRSHSGREPSVVPATPWARSKSQDALSAALLLRRMVSHC